jgi:Cytochrome P450
MAINRELQSKLDQRPPKPRRAILARLTAGLLNRPDWLRPLFLYVFPHIQWLFLSVARRRDVREVLVRDEDFTIGSLYGPAMECGDFVFGADRGRFFREETAFLWETFYGPSPYPPGRLPAAVPVGKKPVDDRPPPPPAAALSERVKARVGAAIEAAGHDGGELDLVQNVIRPECCRIAQEHLGVGPPDEKWVKVLWEILGILALHIILPSGNMRNDKQSPAAFDLVWAKETLVLAIEQQIAAVSVAAAALPPSIVGRMYSVLESRTPVPPPKDIQDKIIRNISGLATVMCHSIAKSAAHAVDSLLSHPEAFEGAKEAAKAGDENLFWAFIEEALRFFPAFPLVLRACPRDTMIGADSGHPSPAGAGKKIAVGLLAGMFDPAEVPFPDQFRTDRDPNGHLVFGYGKHACFGYYFAREMLIALLMPLFAHGFARAPGRKGKLKFDLVMPKSLYISLSAPAAAAAQG